MEPPECKGAISLSEEPGWGGEVGTAYQTELNSLLKPPWWGDLSVTIQVETMPGRPSPQTSGPKPSVSLSVSSAFSCLSIFCPFSVLGGRNGWNEGRFVG